MPSAGLHNILQEFYTRLSTLLDMQKAPRLSDSLENVIPLNAEETAYDIQSSLGVDVTWVLGVSLAGVNGFH